MIFNNDSYFLKSNFLQLCLSLCSVVQENCNVHIFILELHNEELLAHAIGIEHFLSRWWNKRQKIAHFLTESLCCWSIRSSSSSIKDTLYCSFG